MPNLLAFAATGTVPERFATVPFQEGSKPGYQSLNGMEQLRRDSLQHGTVPALAAAIMQEVQETFYASQAPSKENLETASNTDTPAAEGPNLKVLLILDGEKSRLKLVDKQRKDKSANAR
jgi:hypothetical protein